MSSNQSNLLQVLHKRVETLLKEGKIEDAVRVGHTAVEAARRRASADRNTMSHLASALLMMGDVHRLTEDYEAAEETYLEGLQIMEGVIDSSPRQVDEVDIARLQSGLASVYDFTSREEDALPMYEAAAVRLESLDPPKLEESAHISNNVGMIYKHLGHMENASSWYQRALQLFEEIDGDQDVPIATVLNNLGTLQSALGDLEAARKTHLRALEIRESIRPQDLSELSQSLCNLATVYHQLDDFPKARKHYEMAIKLLERELDPDDSDYSILMENFSQLLRDRGHERKAEQLEKRMQSRLRKAQQHSLRKAMSH